MAAQVYSTRQSNEDIRKSNDQKSADIIDEKKEEKLTNGFLVLCCVFIAVVLFGIAAGITQIVGTVAGSKCPESGQHLTPCVYRDDSGKDDGRRGGAASPDSKKTRMSGPDGCYAVE